MLTPNMSWPRRPADPWYLNHAMILTTVAVAGP
jgi:hypothetical protein